MAGCSPPPPSYPSVRQPFNFLHASFTEHAERSLLGRNGDVKRPLKRKSCQSWDEGDDCGFSSSKKFVSEEEMSSCIQQLNIANTLPPTTNTLVNTPPLINAAHQLNIKTVSSCKRSLEHKRNRRLSDSTQDISPTLKRACLHKRGVEKDHVTASSAVIERSGRSKSVETDQMTHHKDLVTKHKSHMIPTATNNSDEMSQGVYPIPVIPSRLCTTSPTETSHSILPPTTLYTTGYFDYCPVRGEQAAGHSEMSNLSTTRYSCSLLQDDDDDDDDVTMTESVSEKQSSETTQPDRTTSPSSPSSSSLVPPPPSRSMLSLSDVLKKMGGGRGGVTLEDLSSDSDGGPDGPERPLSVWIAPELQQSLSLTKNSQADVLPPSILEQVNRPKGMELVPWVEPEKRTKIYATSESVVDMSEQDTAPCGDSGTAAEHRDTLQRMESVDENGGLLDYDEHESDMESD